MPSYISDKNIDLVTRHGIFTENEFRARYEIHMEAYCKLLHIEAQTSIDMIRHQILPAAMRYTRDLSAGLVNKKSLGIPCRAESRLVERLSDATDKLYDHTERLGLDLMHVPTEDHTEAARYYHSVILSDMAQARAQADLLEELTDKSYWPYPTYSDLLFY